MIELNNQIFTEIREIYRHRRNKKVDPEKNFAKFLSNTKDNIVYISSYKGDEMIPFASWDRSDLRFRPEGIYVGTEAATIVCDFITGEIERIQAEPEDQDKRELRQADKIVETLNSNFQEHAYYMGQTVF